MKIYTKRGDDGTTGLLGAPRVSKDHVRVAAYGDVDELNSVLGLVRAEQPDAQVDGILARLQGELFTLGAQLATPGEASAPRGLPRLVDDDVARLEAEIDAFESELEPLRSFILPGGTRTAAMLHLARTVCRRAERALVTLAAQEPVAPLALPYVNRLSDHLFVLARLANARSGTPEPRWPPPQAAPRE